MELVEAPVVDAAVRLVYALPDAWFDEERTDAEVLGAAFGADWDFSQMPMIPGLSTRFWFLERPEQVLAVALARDHEIEPYRRGERLAARRMWQRPHLVNWIARATAHGDWVDLLAAETTARLGRGHVVSPRASRFFTHWATRHLADPERRSAVLMLAALGGYANAADLIREHTATQDPRG